MDLLQIPPKRKMICSPCLLASSTKRYADDGACVRRARRAPHGSKTSRACWRCRWSGHAKAGVHACCADGLFHSARRHPRAPVWVHPPRGRLPQHLGQHLQEQGPHRLLRAAVRGKLCTCMLACSLVRLGILRAAAVHFTWAPVVTRPEQGTGRLSVGLNTSRKWTALVGHFSVCTGVNLPGRTWHFARVSNASFRRGHAMQCGGFQLSISSDWIRQWLTYTILFGADKTMCVRSTCRTASSALTSSRAAPSSSRGRCGVLGF